MRSRKTRPVSHAVLAGALVATGALAVPAAPALATGSADATTSTDDVVATDGANTDDQGPRADLTPVRPRRDFVPGEVLVRFRAGVGASGRAAARASVGASVKRRLPVRGVELLRVEGGVKGAVASLERRRDVVYAEPNYLYRATVTPDDPRWRRQWGLHNTGQTVDGVTGTVDADIDAPKAWDITTGDSAVTVAVVDTGVAYLHSDLRPNIWRNRDERVNGVDDDGNGYVDDIRGWDFVGGDRSPADPSGHGTHVAGTIGAVGDDGRGMAGVAWDVSLMPLRVLATDGSGTAADVASAFAYAADNGADVVNASFGGPEAADARVLEDAIAAAPDTLFVVAAGNGGADNDAAPTYPCSLPADNIVCVAATDNRDRIAGFSNRGATSVDLGAPGVGIVSTVPYATVRTEGFGSGWRNRWRTGGVGVEWGIESDANGPFASDSPGRRYARNSDSRLRTARGLDLRGLAKCNLDYSLRLKTQLNRDGLLVEGKAGTGSWKTLNGYSGDTRGWRRMRESLRAFDGKSRVHLRYALVSDGSYQYRGAHVDDVSVTCRDSTFTRSYTSADGTSMAAPHVAGAAALLHSVAPDAGVDVVRRALLDGAEARSSLAGKTVTGGRLDVKAALDLMPPALRFSRTTFKAAEGAGAATVTVERIGDAGVPVSVGYATADGTASAGEDYTATTGTLTVPAGARTATFPVPLLDDEVLEGTEKLALSLTAPDGAALLDPRTATLSITDDEPPAVVSFTRKLRTVSERAGTVQVRATRSGDTSVPASVTYRRTAGTARAGSDFTGASGTLDFAPGETSKTFPVTILDDRAREAAEAIVFSLAPNSPITEVGEQATSKLRIAASDQRPDALVSKARRSGYVGNDVYNKTGRYQTRVSKARRTNVRTFYVRVYNDGNVRNTFRLKGSTPRAGSRIVYLRGSTNVTRAMRSETGLKVRIRPGRFVLLKVRVKVLSTAVIGSRKPAKVRAIWTGDGTRVDVVRGIVKVVR